MKKENTMKPVTEEMLRMVGKKMAKQYRKGEVSDTKIVDMYLKNKRRAEEFDGFNYSVHALMKERADSHNPCLKEKIDRLIKEHKEKQLLAESQNLVNIERYDNLYSNAWHGRGLRSMMSALKWICKHGADLNAKILHLILSTEVANVCAKKCSGTRRKIYQRKDILMRRLADLLHQSDWKFGISANPGKNASYVVYCYLPDGEQLSWHSQNHDMYKYFPPIDVSWDGQASSVLTKIENYLCKYLDGERRESGRD